MQNIIEKYNIKAKKSLGQNFLMDEKILNQISSITNISWENIVEIWPWFWALTERLLKKNPNSITLIELDDFMISILNDRIQKKELDLWNVNFRLVKEDVLKVDLNIKNYKVIANIPYYITSPILFKFLYLLENKPKEMIILMQKEVWDKIISKKSSVLSLEIQKKCVVQEKIFVPKTAFFPIPKVNSSVLFFQVNDKFSHIPDDTFLSFIKASFSNPRKKMLNNLKNAWYNKEKILKKLVNLWFSENTRAEELNINDYVYLLDDN